MLAVPHRSSPPVLIAAVVCSLAVGALPGAAQTQARAAVETELRHADTYLRFALDEENQVETLEKALEHARRAEQLASIHRPAAWANADARVADAQAREIEAQLGFARGRLFGRFPLLHVLGGTLLSGRTQPGNFELFRAPGVAATEEMVRRLVELIGNRWSNFAQTDVVMVPGDPVLDAVALAELNRSPKFWIRTFAEVERAFGGRDPSAELARAADSGEGVQQLQERLGATSLLLARVRRVDSIGNDHFFELAGELTHAGAPGESHKLSAYGFARDARGRRQLVLGFNVGVFAAAVFVYALLARRRRGGHAGIGEVLVSGAVGFLAGRCSPWFLVDALERLEPPPNTPLIQGLWWPAILPAIVTLGPALVHRLVVARLRHRLPALANHGRSDGAAWLLLGSGGAAHLATAMLIHHDVHGAAATLASLGDALALCVAGGICLHLIGRALDRADGVPWWVAAVAVLELLGLGLATCSVQSVAILAVAVVVVATLVMTERRLPWVFTSDLSAGGDGKTPTADSECAELVAACDHPPFWSVDQRRQGADAVALAARGTPEWIRIRGKVGSGRSVLADALIDDFQRSASGQRPEVLRIVGKQTGEPRPPFEPFEAVLAQLGVSTGESAGGEEESARALVDSLFGEIPFAHILLGGGGDGLGETGPQHVRALLVDNVRRLARRRPVAVVFEHANWLHPLSQDVISALHRLGPRQRLYLLVLITESPGRRDRAALEVATEIRLAEPDQEALLTILTASIGLESEAAQRILDESGTPPTGLGRLQWLLQVTRSLAVEGHFQRSPEGYRLRPEITARPSLPIPQELDEVFRAAFQRAGGGRRILECAACAGEEFDARVVADAVDESLIAVLESLRAVGEESGLVAESERGGLRFRFSSPQMRKAMLHWIGDVPDAEGARGRKALAQAHHLGLAAAWERRLADDPAAIYSIANHLYWAGSVAGSAGPRRAFEAAEEALRRLDHEGARRYADMALELAEGSGTLLPHRELALRIACSEAHVEGRDRQAAAKAILDFVAAARALEPEWQLLAAQTCYDAAGETNDQRLFAKAVELGKLAARSAAPSAARSIGHLFAALGLPPSAWQAKEQELRAGLALLDGVGEPGTLAARAKLENALAEVLGFGPGARPDEARTLFESSIALKSGGGVIDLPGLARARGGLGRLALFAQPPRLDEAEQNFRLDLEISIRIGDLAGVTQMHSLLGLCALGRTPPDYEEALACFDQSLEHARGPRDRIFAQIGRLRSLAGLRRWEQADRAGQNLAVLVAENGIPRGAVEDLTRAIADAEPGGEKEWLSRLRGLLGAPAPAQRPSQG